MTAAAASSSAVGHFEHQLVMDLQEHPDPVEARLGKRIVHPRHRALDEVGAGALDRRVDRGALGAPRGSTGLGERMFGSKCVLRPNRVLREPPLARERQACCG